ncbi:MAG TPA: hypothetical protein VLC54_17870, partial [Anaeromyxobacter sp.]|nr:hypothetical protein [Anaeromyxobacter sp.]
EHQQREQAHEENAAPNTSWTRADGNRTHVSSPSLSFVTSIEPPFADSRFPDGTADPGAYATSSARGEHWQYLGLGSDDAPVLLDQRVPESDDPGDGRPASHRENTLYLMLRATMVNGAPVLSGSVWACRSLRFAPQGSGRCSGVRLS